MVFMPLVMVLIGQFCSDVIGYQNLKVAVIDPLLFYYYFWSVCWGYLLSVGSTVWSQRTWDEEAQC